MRYNGREKCGCFSIHFRHFPQLFGGLALLSAGFAAQAQDDYLRALEAEAEKVAPARVTPGTEESASEPRRAVADESGEQSVEGFEALLEKQYRGTFAFYKQLSPATRQEIYERFVTGTDMAALRELIVERYLSR